MHIDTVKKASDLIHSYNVLKHELKMLNDARRFTFFTNKESSVMISSKNVTEKLIKATNDAILHEIEDIRHTLMTLGVDGLID